MEQAQADHGHDRMVLGAQVAERVVQSIEIHAAAVVEPHADHMIGSQAEDSRRAGDAVMGIGVDQ